MLATVSASSGQTWVTPAGPTAQEASDKVWGWGGTASSGTLSFQKKKNEANVLKFQSEVVVPILAYGRALHGFLLPGA